MTPKPLLLLDVDGPLNPWTMDTGEAAAKGYTSHYMTAKGSTDLVHLHPDHGTGLRALMPLFDLVWASTWGNDANHLISPVLGLPTDLPVVPWPDGTRSDSYRRGSWKTPHIPPWTAGRPFVWFDDEINSRDRRYLAQTNGIGPHLALRVHPHHGLRDKHFTTAKDWALALT